MANQLGTELRTTTNLDQGKLDCFTDMSWYWIHTRSQSQEIQAMMIEAPLVWSRVQENLVQQVTEILKDTIIN